MKRNDTEGLRAAVARIASGIPRNGWIAAVAFLAALAGLIFIGPASSTLRSTLRSLEPGKIAEQDIYAGKDAVYIDKEATERKIEAESRLVLAVFMLDSTVTDAIRSRAQNFSTYYLQIIGEQGSVDALALLLKSRFPDFLDLESMASLVRARLAPQAFVPFIDIVDAMLARGITSVPEGLFERYNPTFYELVRMVNGKEESEQLPVSGMITIANLSRYLEEEMNARRVPESVKPSLRMLFRASLRENVFFDEARSSRRLAAVRARVQPVTRFVSRNQLLVRKGELVTEDMYKRILEIRSAVLISDVSTLMMGIGLLVVATLIAVLLAMMPDLSDFPADPGSQRFVILAFLLFFFVVLVVQELLEGNVQLSGHLFVPASLFAGLLSLLFSPKFGVYACMVSLLLAAAATNLNMTFTMGVFLAGLAATMTMRTAHSRIQLARAAVLQAGIQALLALLLMLNRRFSAPEIARSVGLGALNGFVSGSFILLLLPLFEHLLDRPTRFRLMELSDTNSEALRELQSKAPGTYAHSMTVAQLAEAAAKEIGADPILARIAAYYHDLGKIEHPEYFIENQAGGVNPHDSMNPTLSATILRSHVTQGIEIARGLGFPRAVLDVIEQHHGDSVMKSMLGKAAASSPDPQTESTFRYNGRKPSSKEAGIVMLADSVEAVSRLLMRQKKQPTPSMLQDAIHKVVKTKLEEGQLDECDLTLKELGMVEEAFFRILSSHMHKRIEYPQEPNHESGERR